MKQRLIEDQLCNAHQTTCKFCKKPIEIWVDAIYDTIGDPLKLLPLAACDRCADLRERRRKLEEMIKRTCERMTMKKGEELDKFKSAARITLTTLTKSYSRLAADWCRSNMPLWDEECVNAIMDSPKRWNMALEILWKMQKSALAVS